MSSAIVVVGSGAWGTAISVAFSTVVTKITIVSNSAKASEEINVFHSNCEYLPNVILQDNIFSSMDYGCIADAQYVIVAVPTASVLQVVQNIMQYIDNTQKIIIASKGFDEYKGVVRFLSDIILELYGVHVSIMSGPNFALEVASHLKSVSMIASHDLCVANQICRELSSENFMLYPTSDVIGIQIAGGYKNVVAIYTGYLFGLQSSLEYRGLEHGENNRARVISDSISELMNVIEQFGGDKFTALSYAGIGDIILSCSSRSRNYRYGMSIATMLPDVVLPEGMLVEGAKNTLYLMRMCTKYGGDFNILQSTCNLLNSC